MARYTAHIRGQGALVKTIKSGAERGIQIDLESPMLETRVIFGGPGGDTMTIFARESGGPADSWKLLQTITRDNLRQLSCNSAIPRF